MATCRSTAPARAGEYARAPVPQFGPVTRALAATQAACDPAADQMATSNIARLLRAELDHLRTRIDRVSRILSGLEREPLFSEAELASIGERR